MKITKKKVAFCFSGQARTLDLCCPYIKKNLLDPVGKNKKDYDIFCCVEDDEDAHKIDPLNPTKTLKITSNNPGLEFDEVLNQNYKKYFANDSFRGYLNQLKKIFLSNQLRKDYQKENNISYKWVVRARFDFLPIGEIDYSKLNNNYLYVPKTFRGGDSNNDMFAVGNEKVLDIYSDQIIGFKKVLKTFFLKKPKTSLRVSFFLEKLYISFFEFLSKISKKEGALSKFFKKMIIIRGNFFLRPPTENNYNSESALFRHLKANGVKAKIIDLDYAIVRKKWSVSGVHLGKQN